MWATTWITIGPTDLITRCDRGHIVAVGPEFKHKLLAQLGGCLRCDPNNRYWSESRKIWPQACSSGEACTDLLKPRPVEPQQAFVGAEVTWMHAPRGGYGYRYPVNAVIKKLSEDRTRATVEVALVNMQVVLRSVRLQNLYWRRATKCGSLRS